MKLRLKHLFGIVLLCGCFSCSQEQDDFLVDTQERVPTYRLRFDADVKDYDDGTHTTRSTRKASWDDGDRVYLRFHEDGGTVSGVAIYDGDTDMWNIQPDRALASTDLSDCDAYYFLNPSGTTASRVSLTSSSAVYADTVATYQLYDDLLIVTAVLQPKTGRIRFKGVEGQNFKVNGLSHYTEYSFYDDSYKQKEFVFTASVAEDGFSPFAYAFFTDAGDRTLGFDYTDKSLFKRTFPSTTLNAGESGYITIPTIEAYDGWTLTNKENGQEITLPVLSAVEVDPIRSFSAHIAATIISDGNGHLSDTGFILSQTPGATLSDGVKIPCTTPDSVLAVNQKNLTPETQYYVKAYAVNEKGTVLSAEMSFITKQDPGGSSFDTDGFDQENDWDKNR